ncbi:MAG: hypothetical protein MZV63_16875 [Marinilabiliales bacterium]|nr:hypothetical protein [Marinilabiliales bacterium]
MKSIECGIRDTIHPHDTDIVTPRDTKLKITLWFHQLFGNKGISRIAIENGRETLKGGLD